MVEDLESDASDSEGEGEVGAREEEKATETTLSPLAGGGDGSEGQRYRRTEHDEDEGDISTDEVPDVIVTSEEDGTGEEKEKYIMEKSAVSGNGVARPPLPPR